MDSKDQGGEEKSLIPAPAPLKFIELVRGAHSNKMNFGRYTYAFIRDGFFFEARSEKDFILLMTGDR